MQPLTNAKSDESDVKVIAVEPEKVHVTGRFPSAEWKQRALVILHNYSGLKRRPIDKAQSPEVDNVVSSTDISPRMRDAVRPEGNCLFRALSKGLTGTERNHIVVCLAIVNFMSRHSYISDCIGIGSMNDYLVRSQMGQQGTWGTDVEIAAIATMLDINVVVSAISETSRQLHVFQPVVNLLHTQSHNEGQDHQRIKFYLYHTDARNHYDRMIPAIAAPET